MQKVNQKLLAVFQSIKLRHSALFFSKLILFSNDDADIDLHAHVRHYDIQCEAIMSIADILQTKIKAVQLKTLHIIRENVKMRNGGVETRTGRSISKNSHGSVRSYHASPKTTYARSPQNYYKQYNLNENGNGNGNVKSSTNLRYCPSEYYTRDLNERTNIKLPNNQRMRQDMAGMDCSMQALIEKVKNLNNKFGQRSQLRQYPSNPQIRSSYTRPQSPLNNRPVQINPKLQKRRLIMQKLSKLETDLNSFLSDDHPMSQNNETAINESRFSQRQRFSQGQRSVNYGYQHQTRNQGIKGGVLSKQRPSGTEYYTRGNFEQKDVSYQRRYVPYKDRR